MYPKREKKFRGGFPHVSISWITWSFKNCERLFLWTGISTGLILVRADSLWLTPAGFLSLLLLIQLLLPLQVILIPSLPQKLFQENQLEFCSRSHLLFLLPYWFPRGLLICHRFSYINSTPWLNPQLTSFPGKLVVLRITLYLSQPSVLFCIQSFSFGVSELTSPTGSQLPLSWNTWGAASYNLFMCTHKKHPSIPKILNKWNCWLAVILILSCFPMSLPHHLAVWWWLSR